MTVPHLKDPNETDMKINEHLWASVLVTSQKKCTHQWWLTGARTKIVWKTKTVKCLTSYTEGPDPTEQVTKCHHRGNEHEPPHKRLTTLLGMSMRIHHTRGVSSSPVSLFSSFYFHDMLTRALYNKCRYRYRYSPVEKNPHLFLLHHSCIGLTLSQYVETIFWSVKIPNPLVTDTLV